MLLEYNVYNGPLHNQRVFGLSVVLNVAHNSLGVHERAANTMDTK